MVPIPPVTYFGFSFEERPDNTISSKNIIIVISQTHIVNFTPQ